MPTARDANGNTIELRAGKFDYVKVKGSVSLYWLSKELRIDKDELYALNSSLVKGVTPPKAEYRIRLPEGMGEYARYVLQRL